MAEKGDIAGITVAELARRADISKTTFYYHYEDIYAVAEEFENELVAVLSAVLPLSPDPDRRQVQICFLSSACLDVVVEYFYGNLTASLDTVTEVITEAIQKLERPL